MQHVSDISLQKIKNKKIKRKNKRKKIQISQILCTQKFGHITVSHEICAQYPAIYLFPACNNANTQAPTNKEKKKEKKKE